MPARRGEAPPPEGAPVDQSEDDEMPVRLACPECDAVYEVPSDAIPPDGREVECSACGRRWRAAGEVEVGAEADRPEPPHRDDADDAPEDDADDAPADDEDGAADDLPRPPPVRDPRDMRILREEAERERRLRRGEPAGDDGSAEAAPEGSADAPPPRVTPTRPARPAARSERPARLRPAAAAVAPPPSGPGRLPRVPEADGEAAPRRGGFGRGFLGVVVLAAILAALYLYAGDVARAVPAAAPAVEGYVAAVDAARDAAEDAMRRAVAAAGG